MQKIIKIRIILWSILACVTLWLLYMGIVPGGHIVYSTNLDGDDFFIGKLTPTERVQYEEGAVAIIGDPAYFNLRTPRPFDRAILTFKYRHQRINGGFDPIIEAGVLADKVVWRYDLKPLENRTIDQLLLAWDIIREDDIVLLQRNRTFDSLAAFLESTTSPDRIAAYNYDPQKEYLLPDYEAQCVEERPCYDLPVSLRGSYQFYTYVKNEELDFRFTFLDLNENRDGDPVDIFLYYEDALIESRHLDDDGVTSDNREKSEERELALELPNLPEGVYKIEVRAGGDIITGKIATGQSRLSFINKVELAKAGGKYITLWTDSRKIQATTVYPESLQVIGAGDDELEIDATYKQFELALDRATTSDPQAIFLDRDGLILSGDGLFAFSPEAYLNPRVRRVNGDLDINGKGIDYVVARYAGPAIKGEWHEAQAVFDLKRAYREDGKYGFIISIPGLKTDDETDDAVLVGGIKVELLGVTLWEKIKDIIAR